MDVMYIVSILLLTTLLLAINFAIYAEAYEELEAEYTEPGKHFAK